RPEIYERRDAIRITRADRAQLLPRDGVPNEHRTLEPQRVEDSDDIVTPRVAARCERREIRLAKAAPRDAIDVEIGRELRSALVEDMRCIAPTREQHESSPTTTPIEHLEANVLADWNESASMGRRVLP